MKDQVVKLNEMSIPAVYIADENELNYEKVTQEKYKFIIGSPESVITDKFTSLLKALSKEISIIFIQESHCVSTM